MVETRPMARYQFRLISILFCEIHESQETEIITIFFQFVAMLWFDRMLKNKEEIMFVSCKKKDDKKKNVQGDECRYMWITNFSFLLSNTKF